MRPSLQDLELVHDKVLAQARNRSQFRSQFQVPQAPLEEMLLGQDGQGRCASLGQQRRQRGNVEVGPDQSLGRRSLLEFRDDGRTMLGPGAQDGRESARRVRRSEATPVRRGSAFASAPPDPVASSREFVPDA
jgi:hypothetical protein